MFVLTHHLRPALAMKGGTTFHVRLGGGAATIWQFLRAGLVDELHLVIVPVLLGAGERLFDDLAGLPAGYACTELVGSGPATHARITRLRS